MSLSLAFYLDAALTQPVSAGAPGALAALIGGSGAQRQLWLGSAQAGRVFRDLASPGDAQIQVEVLDADDQSGQPASSITLALTQAGLDAPTPGAPLNVGTEIVSGVAGAVPFWLRWSPAGTVAGVFTDLSLQTSEVVEVAA